MRIRDQYDWIVIGDHPGALLSASVIARSGFSVLVLPVQTSRQERMVWSVETGACLDQESNYVLGLGAAGSGAPGLLHSCLEWLGMTLQEKSLIEEQGGDAQILTAQARIHLGSRLDRLADELGFELGFSARARLGLAQALEATEKEQQAHWQAVYEQALRELAPPATANGGAAGSQKGAALPVTLSALLHRVSKLGANCPPAARDWLSLDQEARAWVEARSVGQASALLEGVVAGASSCQAPRDLRMFEVLALLAMSRSGASFRGGLSGLREMLRRLARRNGADLPSGVSCQRIFIQQGKFVGVLPSGHGTMVSSVGGTLGYPLELARFLIASNGRDGWMPGRRTHSSAGWKFSLALVVNDEAIQPGVTRRMCWQEGNAPLLEIELARSNEYGISKGSGSVVFLRTGMPMTAESLTPRFQRLMAARMLRKATELLPFLEFHILRIFPEFRPEVCPELSMIYGFRSLEEIPGHLLLFQRAEGAKESWRARSGIDRLFLASQEAYPELGSLGWTAAALEAACWLAAELRKSGKLDLSPPPPLPPR